MAQLTDDCFAFGGTILTLGQAQERLIDLAKPSHREEFVRLDHLKDRILSQPLAAQRSVPPFINSAVDGYAYRAGEGPDLTIGPLIAAGESRPAPLLPGHAARILTGAPLPLGADTVIMDEDAILQGKRVCIRPELEKGSNVRQKGEDFHHEQMLYSTGVLISGLDRARLAAGGIKGAWVRPPLRIGVVSTGDEIHAGQIADANRWLIQAVFSGPAFKMIFAGYVPDDVQVSKEILQSLKVDLILTSGGVSVGDCDKMREAIEDIGTLEFWRVAIKPGRPVAFGQVHRTPIFGLPGNPVACFVTARFLALPYALALLGHEHSPPLIQAPLGVNYRKKAGRTEFLRVCLDSQGYATPYKIAGAGIISSLTQANALAVLEDSLDIVKKGTYVPILPLEGLLR